MAPFIATQIEDAADVSIEKGKSLYRAYFVNTKIWTRYKANVDAILKVDGYEACIVTE